MIKNLLIIFAIIFYLNNALAQQAITKIRISQVVEHPALDMTTKGIIDTLLKNGYKKGESLDLRIESAQASPVVAAQIASKFVNQSPDLVVSVGTLSTQSLVKYAIQSKIKLVFSTVTSPYEIGATGANISGVSNFIDLEPQIDLFIKLQPQLKKLGILYNPGELNSVSIVNQLEKICVKYGLILVKQTISKTADSAQAATKLANNADAIFISNDNTALSSLNTIINAANAKKIPVYVSDTDAVESGALAALGPNQYNIGVQTGEMILKILSGTNINDIPIEFPKQQETYINLDTAKKLGIDVSSELLSSAKLIKKTS
jgi:putative tryptophan/tyrosine transport system substrate-binding protein